MEKYRRAGQATGDIYLRMHTSIQTRTHNMKHVTFPLQDWLQERASVLPKLDDHPL